MIYEISIWDQNIKRHLKFIKDNALKIKKVFLNCFNDTDYPRMGGSQTFLLECLILCKHYNIPILLGVLYSEKFNQIKLEIPESFCKKIEWSTYYIHRTFYLMSLNHNYQYNKNINLDIFNNKVNYDCSNKFLYINLNNIAKYHRCLTMDLLEKYKLIEQGAIAWRNVNREYNNAIDSLKDIRFPYKYWTPKLLYLDQINVYNIESQEILPIEYNQSFMQIVTESESNLFIISEKTAVPLIFNKPFLVASCKHFHKNLQDLGFKLYDEIFNYDFDAFDKIEDRVEGLIQNVVKIKDFDKSQAFELIKEKLEYNRNLAISMFCEKVPNDIVDIATEVKSFEHLLRIKDIKNNVY